MNPYYKVSELKEFLKPIKGGRLYVTVGESKRIARIDAVENIGNDVFVKVSL